MTGGLMWFVLTELSVTALLSLSISCPTGRERERKIEIGWDGERKQTLKSEHWWQSKKWIKCTSCQINNHLESISLSVRKRINQQADSQTANQSAGRQSDSQSISRQAVRQSINQQADSRTELRAEHSDVCSPPSTTPQTSTWNSSSRRLAAFTCSNVKCLELHGTRRIVKTRVTKVKPEIKERNCRNGGKKQNEMKEIGKRKKVEVIVRK